MTWIPHAGKIRQRLIRPESSTIAHKTGAERIRVMQAWDAETGVSCRLQASRNRLVVCEIRFSSKGANSISREKEALRLRTVEHVRENQRLLTLNVSVVPARGGYSSVRSIQFRSVYISLASQQAERKFSDGRDAPSRQEWRVTAESEGNWDGRLGTWNNAIYTLLSTGFWRQPV